MKVTRAILPIMRSQKSGHIFNIASAAGYGVSLTAWFTGLLYGLFGDKTYLAGILLFSVAADLIVGICLALVGKSKNTEHGRFSSEVCFRGLIKKSLIMVVILVAIGVDRVTYCVTRCSCFL